MFSLSSFFRRQPESLIGLDISPTAVKLVELGRRGQDDWVLECCAMEPLSPDWIADGSIVNFDEVAAAVRRLLTKSGTHAKQAALALPSSAVITKRVTLPGNLSELEMEILVESEASQYIPFSLEEVQLDFCIIGPSPRSAGDVDVLVAATRKEKADERQEIAQAANLKPVVLDISSFAARLALGRVLQHPNTPLRVQQTDLIALIKVDARGYAMQVLRGEEVLYDTEQSMGGVHLTQAIARHYNLSLEEAEQKKRTNDLPASYSTEVLAPFVRSLAQDVARSLQFFFASTPYSSVQHILLFGGSAPLEGLAQTIGTHTGIATEVLDPFSGMRFSAAVNQSQVRKDAAAYLTACGLALRRFYQ